MKDIRDIALSYWKTDNTALVEATGEFGPSFQLDKHEIADEFLRHLFE